MVSDLLTQPPEADENQRSDEEKFNDQISNDFTPDQLAAMEARAASPEAETGANSGSGHETKKLGVGFTGQGEDNKKTKWKRNVGFGIGGLLGILCIIGIIVMLLGNLKIIHIAENMTLWSGARTAREYRGSTIKLTEEAIFAGEMESSTINSLKSRFGETRFGQAIERYNSLRPSVVAENMGSKIKPVFSEGEPRILGLGNKRVFEGYDVGGTFVEKRNTSFFHPIENYREKLRFSADMEVALERSGESTSGIIRNRGFKQAMADIGVPLRGWERKGQGYGNNISQSEAQLKSTQETFERVNKSPDSNCLVASTCSISSDVNEKIKETVDDAESLADDNKGGAALADTVTTEAAEVIEQGVKGNYFTKSLEIASTTYAIAMPLCLIYEGSLQNSGEKIDASEIALERTFGLLKSQADQQKTGEATAMAIAGMSGRLGNMADSVPLRRATDHPVDTASEIIDQAKPQSSSSGVYSLFDVAFQNILPADIVSSAEDQASTLCSILTRTDVAAAEAALEVALAVFTGGGSKAGEEAVETGLRVFLTRMLDKSIEKGVVGAFRTSGIKAATEMATKKGGVFFLKTGFFVAATVGATELAKLAVLKQTNALNTGISTDEELANQADMGGVVHYQRQEKEFMHGRPLTPDEVIVSREEDLAYIKRQEQSKSFTSRYFALSNPNSLLTRVGYMASSNSGTSLSFGNRVLSFVGKSTTQSLKPVANFFLGKRAFAAVDTGQGVGDYNIVQWGYSKAEEDLIKNDNDFSPLMNDMILEESGKKQEIEDKYGECFTNTNGKLLSEGMIQREADGKVKKDAGKCSPKNLGSENDEFGSKMVFRWRLSKRYSNVLDQLSGIQNPEPEEPQGTGSALGGALPTAPVGPEDIEDIPPWLDPGKGCNKAIASNVRSMLEAADVAGVRLTGSCWRDPDEQIRLRSVNGCPDIYNSEPSACRVPTAKPGTSNHEKGLAIDFDNMCYPDGKTCPSSPGWVWLTQNASKYGLQQLSSEAWHWSVDGR